MVFPGGTSRIVTRFLHQAYMTHHRCSSMLVDPRKEVRDLSLSDCPQAARGFIQAVK